MTFAFKNPGMLSLTSCLAFAASSGCIATSPVEFPEDENFPPSVISEEGAQYPLREIGELNLDVPVEVRELPLEVIVRDPNVDQTLSYRVFVDAETVNSSPIIEDTIEPFQGEVERPNTFNIPYDFLLPAGVCHKVEVVVTGAFAPGAVEPRRPVEAGDIDNRTWWIEVIDFDNPTIEEACR
jgi:hypothetical protein